MILYAYVRREAVLSSQIEGTQSSLSDLLFRGEEVAYQFTDVQILIRDFLRDVKELEA